jgi:hypothetical protein
MDTAAGDWSYRQLLALPHAFRVFSAALVGRLAYALLPLSTLFTIQESTGSFAAAGVAIAVFGVMSVTLPVKSRLVDRRGQRRVLTPLALVSGAALLGVSLLSMSGRGLSPVLAIGLIGVAGLAAPPLGPAMRSTWRRLTDGSEGAKVRAYALDATCEETLYLAGPLLVGLAITIWPAYVSLFVASGALIFGHS